MKVHDRIIEGIKGGVERHWRFTKNLLRVKPEYLLTVSVADALSQGFDDICGLDLEIKLEEPTGAISTTLLMNAVGLSQFFRAIKHRVTRKGNVDIYVAYKDNSWIVELKGFNPSRLKIRKDVSRLREFLTANGGRHNCKGCYLAFPTTSDQKSQIERELASAGDRFAYQSPVFSELVQTQEEPEDGMHEYYANCIAFYPSNAREGAPESNHEK